MPSLLPSSFPSLLHYMQVVDIINGDNSIDRFGESLTFSPDSNFLAIGAPGSIYVKVYRLDKDTSTFTQFGITIHGDTTDDWFGSSLSFSPDSNLLAIGAEQVKNNGPGYVNVYRVDEDASTFIKIGNTIRGDGNGDFFGASVSFSSDSNLLAVGAARWGKVRPGYVNIYRFNEETSTFTKCGNTLEDDNDNDLFGESLSFSPDSNLLAVGVPGGGIGGYVNVYRMNEELCTFTKVESTLEGWNGYRFGVSLSFSPDSSLLAVGAAANNVPGYVNVYRIEENTSTFIQVGDTIEGVQDDDDFGVSLSFSSDSNLLAIGAFQWDQAPGYVNVYRLDEDTSSFMQFGETLEGKRDFDRFGQSVSFSSDSKFLAVGASGNGYVTIYTR